MSTNTANLSAPDNADQSTGPSGYQRTEVGLIPVDWQVLRFCNHFNIYAGGDVPRDSLSQTRSEKYLYPIYANAIQNKGLYGFTSYKRAKSNSVTITARGYLGHAEYRNKPFFPIVRLLVLEPIGSLDARYTTYAINDRVNFSFESTGVPQLTAPQVGKYAVAAPPTIEEQCAIAEALSDVDRLLGALEKLLAKKRTIKQAAMQQLLTGKTRLPGFSGEWNEVRLDDIANNIKTGSRNNRDKVEDGRYPFFVRSETVERINTFSYDCEAIVVPGEGGIGNIFHYINGKFDFHQRVYKISDFLDNVCGKFIYYMMVQWFGDHAMRNTVKATVDSLRLPTFQNFIFNAPVDGDEQHAIAEVLSDIDHEIELLEHRRDKTQKIKQGMMQQLLTGRVRLVNGEAAA